MGGPPCWQATGVAYGWPSVLAGPQSCLWVALRVGRPLGLPMGGLYVGRPPERQIGGVALSVGRPPELPMGGFHVGRPPALPIGGPPCWQAPGAAIGWPSMLAGSPSCQWLALLFGRLPELPTVGPTCWQAPGAANGWPYLLAGSRSLNLAPAPVSPAPLCYCSPLSCSTMLLLSSLLPPYANDPFSPDPLCSCSPVFCFPCSWSFLSLSP